MDELQRLAAFLYGFTPRSALVCSNEGDPPGGGGTPPATPPAPPAPATPAAPVITPEIQAAIDRAAQAAHNAAWKQARETFESKQKQPPAPAKPEAANGQQPQAPDVRSEIARHTAFTRAVGKYDLTDEAFEIVQEEFARSNADDVSSWVAKRASAFSWKPLGQPSTPAAPSPAPSGAPAPAPTAATPPPPMNGTAPPARVVTADTHILDMPIPDREKLLDQLGPSKYAARLEAEFKTDTRRFSLRR